VPAHRLFRLSPWFTLKPLWTLIAVTVAVLVVAGAAVVTLTLVDAGDRCPAGYFRGALHECIGVSDGRYDFIPALHDVDQLILAQNAKVAGQYATVALLLPFTSTDPSIDPSQTDMVHAVEGAYLAQQIANNTSSPGYRRPSIRLVLANAGTDSEQWQPVARQLLGMTAAQDRLRAVAGISVSTAQTISAVSWLTGHGIPVVGGAIVADNLANQPGRPPAFPGLARVEPTNSQEARALARFITTVNTAGPAGATSPATPETAHVVEDLAPHDAYTSTLYQAFRKDTDWQVDTFDSSDAGNLPNDLANDARSICDQPDITWVYFAGRQQPLRLFIDKLVFVCPGRHFTILTGSAASHLVNDPPRKADFQWVTLDYVPIASPATWAGVPLAQDGGSAQGYLGNPGTGAAGFQPAFAAAFPGDAAAGLADGQAIINYDAVLTAVSALEDQTGGNVGVPSLRQVAAFWPLLHGQNTVFGASGLICLDTQGNPYDKVIPIVQYSTTGTPEVVDRIFLYGTPTTSKCFVTNGG
jgi:hypothetical protein